MNPIHTGFFGLNESSPGEIENLGRTIRCTQSKGTDDIDPILVLPTLSYIAHH